MVQAHQDVAGINYLSFASNRLLLDAQAPLFCEVLYFFLLKHAFDELSSVGKTLGTTFLQLFIYILHEVEICAHLGSEASHVAELRDEANLCAGSSALVYGYRLL